jgi:hypothetical protein
VVDLFFWEKITEPKAVISGGRHEIFDFTYKKGTLLHFLDLSRGFISNAYDL